MLIFPGRMKGILKSSFARLLSYQLRKVKVDQME
jgi:hypothetical protein